MTATKGEWKELKLAVTCSTLSRALRCSDLAIFWGLNCHPSGMQGTNLPQPYLHSPPPPSLPLANPSQLFLKSFPFSPPPSP